MSGALEAWGEFNVAMAGATAALVGLVIVAGSVNIAEIVKSRTLTARLGSAIVMLVVALIASALGLVPEIDGLWFSLIVLGLSLAALLFQVMTTRIIVAEAGAAGPARPGTTVAKSVLGYLPIVAFGSGGALALGAHPGALYVVALGCVLSIVVAVVVSWVVLVEILR